MKQLWKELRAWRRECVLGPAFKLLEAVFELIVPLVIGRIKRTKWEVIAHEHSKVRK